MKNYLILFLICLNFPIAIMSDSVTIKKTNQLLENVKTSPSGKSETIIEAKDGSKQVLKNNQITIVIAPVIWEEVKPEEKPGFFKSLFSKKTAEPTADVVSAVSKNAEETKEEPKGFFAKRFPEITMGTMFLLFVFLP